MFDIHTLNTKLLPELKEIAKDLCVPKYQKLKKQELVYEILDMQASQGSIKKKTDNQESPKQRRRVQKPQPEKIRITERAISTKIIQTI